MAPVPFLDSSLIAAAYLADEDGHAAARDLIDRTPRILSSELSRVEVSRAIAAAARSRRMRPAAAKRALDHLARDLGGDGAIEVLPLDGPPTVERALRLVAEHPVGTLDAIHLAVASREGRALAGDDLVFVTRDDRQRGVAKKLGLAVD